MIFCAIWYHLYNFKNVKNTHGGVLLLIKLQASACNFTKSNTLPGAFFMFFKLYKWYQIAQRTTYITFRLFLVLTPASWHMLGLIAPYTNTLEQVFEAKQVNLGRTSMYRTPLCKGQYCEFPTVSAIEWFLL